MGTSVSRGEPGPNKCLENEKSAPYVLMNQTYFKFGYVPAELHQESSICLRESKSKELRTYLELD